MGTTEVYSYWSADSRWRDIKENKKHGLSHIIIDNKETHKIFLQDIFDNEMKYTYLIKKFDSNEKGFTYHVKVFEIDYKKFEEIWKNIQF